MATWIHPFTRLAFLLGSRPPLGPNYLRYFELTLACVADLGLDISTMTRLVGVIHVYVTGFATYELAEEEVTRRTGLTEEDKHTLAEGYMQDLIAKGQHPNLARFFEAGAAIAGHDNFAYGLDCLLDGLAARLPRPCP